MPYFTRANYPTWHIYIMTDQIKQSDSIDKDPENAPLVIEIPSFDMEMTWSSVNWDVALGNGSFNGGEFHLPRVMTVEGRVPKFDANAIEKARDDGEQLQVLSPIEMNDLEVSTLQVASTERHRPSIYAELSEL